MLYLPSGFLLISGATCLGLLTLWIFSRVQDVDTWRVSQRLLLVGVLVARISFVFEYRNGYLEDPWSVLDIRDGGWDVQTGIVAAWLFAILALKERAAPRTPLIAALSVASVVWGLGSMALAMQSRDQELSAVPVPTTAGDSASLAQFKGKPTIVNLWATWCPPCQRELPLLQRAQADHPEAHFVFLNQGEGVDRVRAFLASRGFVLRNVLLDLKGQAGAEYGGGALPTTILFDAQGRLVETHIGELSAGTLAESLDKLRGNREPIPKLAAAASIGCISSALVRRALERSY